MNEKNKASVLESIEELKLMVIANVRVDKNICWWDTKACPYCSEINGFQEAMEYCFRCSRIDEKKFSLILKRIAPQDLFSDEEVEEAIREAREEGIKDGREEAYKEIDEYISDILDGLRALRKK